MARPQPEDRPSSLNRSERPKRVPINGFRNKLTITGQEPGWHYFICNDEDVDKFLAGGYEFVTHEIQVGDRKIDNAQMVGGKIAIPVGNGMTGYVMRCPEEYYKEDMAAIQREVDETERSMIGGLNSKDDGRYGEVKIESSKPLNR